MSLEIINLSVIYLINSYHLLLHSKGFHTDILNKKLYKHLKSDSRAGIFPIVSMRCAKSLKIRGN